MVASPLHIVVICNVWFICAYVQKHIIDKTKTYETTTVSCILMKSHNYYAHYECVEAVRQNNLDFILAKLEDLNFITNNPLSWTPLHYATAFDNYEITRKILDVTYSGLETEDKYKRTPLSIAALKGNAKIVELLLSKGADVSKGLPLLYAATKGHKECVRTLIQSGCNVDEVDEISSDLKYTPRYTPLIIAIKENHVEIVDLLIGSGANTNFGVNKYMTPLHYACQGGRLELVKILLSKGSELNSRCQHDDVPLDISLHRDKFDIVKYLLKSGASVNDFGNLGQTPLHTAVRCNKIEYVEEIVKYNANVNMQDIDGATPLYLCCYHNTINEEIFDFLINSGADVNLKCNKSWTPLHLCCAVGNLKCVRLILGKSANVNVVTMDNITPLYIAAFQGHTEICKELLDNGARINIRINKFKDLCSWYPFDISEADIKVGYTAEYIATEKQQHDVLALLKDYKKMYPATTIENDEIINLIRSDTLNSDYYDTLCFSDTDVLGWTWLHYAAEFGNCNLIKHCISQTIDVNVADKYGRTPLTLAAANGNLEIVEQLIEIGADVHLGSAVFYAIENNQIETVKYLINKNNIVTLDRRKRSPIMYAVIKNNLAIMKLLLQTSPDVTGKDEDGETVLHLACNTSQELLEVLINSNTDVNAQNNCLETPIVGAVVEKNYEVMETLLKHKADPTIADRFKQTPLHYVAEYGTTKFITKILTYSTDINIINSKDSDSYTPFLLSLSNEDTDVFKLLLERGADLGSVLRGGWTALHICASYGKLLMAEELIKRNIDVNALSQEGVSPLYIASARGHQNFVKMLIEKGSLLDTPIMCLTDWKEQSHIAHKLPRLEGATPLVAAICNGHLEIVKMLHSAGASIDVQMEGHMNPLRLAKKSLRSIFHYLKEQKNMK